MCSLKNEAELTGTNLVSLLEDINKQAQDLEVLKDDNSEILNKMEGLEKNIESSKKRITKYLSTNGEFNKAVIESANKVLNIVLLERGEDIIDDFVYGSRTNFGFGVCVEDQGSTYKIDIEYSDSYAPQELVDDFEREIKERVSKALNIDPDTIRASFDRPHM